MLGWTKHLDAIIKSSLFDRYVNIQFISLKIRDELFVMLIPYVYEFIL